ncbi:hypothetical protein HIM_05159 [Hirsutella minnesotensis 3608]|uniref:protein disulfide-isomerase n=1 Tax=Hirsutella minnesotensis 3608 TaxID=1043627 RepID=A0A0F7ZUU3_9HYPO|nr:hypothetical protein HIM_05159 [Hirsutella minnesotensis 3608]
MPHSTVAGALTALLAALPAAQAGMYLKSSPVLQVDAKSYGKLIAKSNHTSIVEFYAPWCGHCQNLKPAYERAAKDLDGLAQVAAIDCDEDANKQFCGSMGVQGFPTLKIVQPSKKPGGKPMVEDYQGSRSANGIVQAVVAKINNHVTRLTDKDAETFLAGDKPKLILFTEKGTTSALLRSVAIDYLDVVSVGQIRSKEKVIAEKYGIEKFPSLLLFRAKGQGKDDAVMFIGGLSKKNIVEFLTEHVGPPNPDPATGGANKGEKAGKPNKKSSSTKASDSKGSKTKASCPMGSDKKTGSDSQKSKSDTTAAESAAPTPDVISINALTSKDMLVEKCLQPKSLTCVLALIPPETSEQGTRVVASLSKLNSKYLHGKRHLFPFFSVASDVDGTSALRDALKLGSGVELVVVNARRGWWRHYEGDFGVESVEAWIDAIRMGEGKKADLPKGVVVEAETASESSSATEQETKATDPEPETKTPEPKEKTAEPQAEAETPKPKAETPEPEQKSEAPGETAEAPEPEKEKIVHEEL